MGLAAGCGLGLGPSHCVTFMAMMTSIIITILLGDRGEEFCPGGLKKKSEKPENVSEASGSVNKRQAGVGQAQRR